jgi:benzoate-CoA ligase family protein
LTKLTKMNLAAELLGDVGERGARMALREPMRSWTYAELAEEVARVGGALQALGVAPGDRVAILMSDGLDAAASILGAIHIGATAVPLSELARPNDIRTLVRDAGAVVAIVHASLEPVLDEIRNEVDSLREVIAVGGARGDERSFEALVAGARPVPPVDPGFAPALLLYSAGPSDRAPRGVPHTHATPLVSFRSFAQPVLALGAKDRVFSLVKLATAYGLGAGLIFPLAAGAESVLLPEQARSPAVFGMMDALPPTVMFATPSIYGQLLEDASKDGADKRFASVRACVSGAEQLPALLHKRIKERFNVDVLSGYGLTEAFHFVFANRPGGSRPGSSGPVLEGFEARLVSEDGHAVQAQEIGTLEIKGPTLTAGYWNQPDESSKAFRGEWLHTEDRFLVDPEGFWFHCGRTDDLFKVGGKWVSPAEVERTLLQHEAVWECAVVGVEDENGLTKPLAYVVPNVGHHGGLQLERELIEYVKKEIAPYKYPRWIEFVESLPKTRDGKVLRYKLPGRRPQRRRDPTVPSL